MDTMLLLISPKRNDIKSYHDVCLVTLNYEKSLVLIIYQSVEQWEEKLFGDLEET